MEVGRKAPKEVSYQDVLPVALPSSSNRRQFLPVNGQTFTPTGSNIIRIDVNADSLLDVQHSYLEFTINNTDSSAGGALFNDSSMSWCNRFSIESAGVTLEDTYEYGRLISLLKNNQVSGSNMRGQESVYSNYNENIVNKVLTAGQIAGTSALDIQTNPVYPGVASNSKIVNGAAGSRTLCVPLVSALMNCEKYIPLILSNQGITLVFTLGSANSIGIATDTAAGSTGKAPQWSITNCRYVAHLVSMDRSFYDALRSEMAMSGSISLHGHSWKHYSNSIAASDTSPSINIPARAKSIKCILSTFKASTADTTLNNYGTACFARENITSWMYRIGSQNYPQSAVTVGAKALAPTLCEVQKAFGKLGDVSMSSNVSQISFGQNESDVGGGGEPLPGNIQSTFCIGYDTEAFSKSALESGINTADRALPITLELTRDSSGDVAYVVTNDNYVCSDLFIYVNADGTMTPSN